MSRKSAPERTQENDPAPAAPPKKRSGLLAKTLILILLAVGCAAGIHWWQGRVLREARAALLADDAEKSLKLMDEYLKKNPENKAALALRARSLVALREQPDEAVKIFDKIGPADADEMEAYAQAQLMLNQWSSALPFFNRVLLVRPDDPEALHGVTACQLRLGMLKGALESAGMAAQCPGHEAKGYVLLAVTYREVKDFPNAVKAFEQALKFEPDAAGLQLTPAEFIQQYGKTLLEAGLPAKAAQQLKRGTSLAPSAEAYADLGEAYTRTGKLPEAVDAWKRAVELDPLNDKARQGLAAVELRNKDPQKALEILKPLETQGRGESATALLLAQAYQEAKDEASSSRWRQQAESAAAGEKQVDEAERLMVEDPGSAWARALRAHRFALAGNWRQAEAMLDDLPKKEVTADLKTYVAALRTSIEKKHPPPPLAQAGITLPKED